MKAGEKITGRGLEMPPCMRHVTIYFIQKGLTEKDALFFFQQHHSAAWKDGEGMPLRNWKTLANDWIWELQQARKRRYNRTKFQH